MLVETKFFGELEIEESSIICFKEGIPGFPGISRYTLIDGGDESPFSYLQAVDDKSICFVVLPPAFIVGDYNIELSRNTVEQLEIEDSGDVMLYAILTIPEEVSRMTANLRAPLVINAKNRKALQEILSDDGYEIKHPVIKEANA